MIAPAGHHCNVRSGHLNATFGGKDMGSMAQTGLLLVPSDALGHTWVLPGVLGGGQGLPPETGPEDLKRYSYARGGCVRRAFEPNTPREKALRGTRQCRSVEQHSVSERRASISSLIIE